MKTIKNILILGTLLASATLSFAQFDKGQKAIGGDFLVFNTTNNFSQTESGFSKNNGTGISLNFNKGKFFRNNFYRYATIFGGLSLGNRETEDNDNLGLNLSRTRYSYLSFGIGGGIRKYYPATDKIGLFINGQISGQITRTRNKFYATQHDTVLRDETQTYPSYDAELSIVPGVYVMLNPKWQLNFNIGNLYLSHTLVPGRSGVVNYSSTTTMGLNFNIFDFRLGILYMPGRFAK